jgi:type VI secretion system protein ImpL
MKWLKKIFKFLIKPPVLWMLIIIIVALIIWFLGPLLAFSDTAFLASTAIRFVLILGMLIIWAICNLSFRSAEARASDAAVAEAEIKKTQGIETSLENFPENYAELLVTSFKTVFDFCLDNKLECYLVIGNANSGKTALLEKSTLGYRLQEETKLPNINIEGLCVWHLTKQAVFLEISEACSNNNTVFFLVLRLLKKFKRKHLLRGGIITCSLQDVLQQTEDQRLSYANVLRQQIHKLQERLGINLPIELVFSKTDLLSGFREFFADLSEDERHLAWGIKLGRFAKIPLQFAVDLDKLINRLERRLLVILNKTTDVQQASLLAGFPLQLAQLKTLLQGFIQRISMTTSFFEPINLCGIYFTSAMQVDQPIDLLLNSVASTFGLEVPVSEYNALLEVKSKAYFLDQLLHTVVMSDAQYIKLTRRAKLRDIIWRSIGYIACGLALIILSSLWYKNYKQNQKAIDWLNQNLAQVRTMDQLRLVYNTFTPEQVKWQTRIGFYSISKLADEIHDFYKRGLHKYFVPEVLATLEQQITTDMADPKSLYSDLRIYLMFAQPSHLEVNAVKTWLAVYWQAQYPLDKTKQTELNSELSDLLAEPLGTITINDNLVAQARVVLNRLTPAERSLAGLQDIADSQDQYNFSGLGNDVQFVQAFSGGDKLTFSPLFTPGGYRNIYQKYKDEVIKQTLTNDWVLGAQESSSELAGDVASELDDLYFRYYINAWNNLSDSLRLTKCGSLQQLGDILTVLASPTSPLIRIISEVNKNTTLAKQVGPISVPKGVKVPGGKVATSGLNKLAGSFYHPTPVDIGFAEMHTISLQTLQQSLTAAAAYVQKTSAAGNVGEAAFKAAADLMANPQNPITQLAQLGDQMPQPVKGWLNDLARQYVDLVLGSAHDYISSAWQAGVYPVYAQSIAGRYPFAKYSDTEANVADVGTFFAPSGVLDKFVQTYLQPFVAIQGNSMRLLNIQGRTVGISSSALYAIQQGLIIKNGMFSSGNKLALSFNLMPVRLDANVAAFNMTINKQQLNYRHGPQYPTAVTWPGDGDSDITVSFIDLNGSVVSKTYQGTWSLFKLIDANKIIQRSADTYILTVMLNDRHVSYMLKAASIANPFNVEALHSFSLPKSL